MSILHKQLPRLKFRHVLKSFPEDLEEQYYDDFYRISLPIVRVALILGIILYSLFGILDIWIVPIHKNGVWLIRYAVVSPILVTVLCLTFFSMFKNHMQQLLAFAGFAAGIGIVLMIGLSVESEPGFKFYYAGLMLVIMWIYALVRLRFIYATAVSLMITASYELIAILINRLLDTPANAMVFVNNNFFFIGSNIIGMFACFTIEWYMRKNFLLREEIAKAYNLNSKYLNNIREGLLLIDDHFTIMSQFSLYLTEMFETTDFEGKNFIDLIYPDPEEHEEERRDLERFMNFLFFNRTADLDMIMELNPFKNKKIEIRKDGMAAGEITVNADFIRIHDKESVEFIMIIFEDITDILNYEKQIQEQKTRHQQEIESVTAILKNGPSLFTDFIEESARTLNDMRSGGSNLRDKKLINHLFREVHSLKGAAKHLELNYITTLSHSIEDILSDLRDNPEENSGGLIVKINELTDELFNEFVNLGKLIERLKGFSSVSQGKQSAETVNPLQDFLDSLPQMADLISKEQNKVIKFKIENTLTDLPFLSKIKNPLIHLIRNSIDHGIEDQFERLSKNKSASGEISVRLYDSGSAYNIEVHDDGGGIDFHKIRTKAVKKNLLTVDSPAAKSKLLQLIFTPGFSSKDQVTDLSGRGFGLDIVKDAVEKLHGKVIVKTDKDAGTTIRMSIPH